MLSLQEYPHRRFNPLTGEWVLVSPHRTNRPWQGQVETTASEAPIIYDSTCYLCPGNERAGGVRNPDYKDTFVFTNDFAALHTDVPAFVNNENYLLQAHTERGICRVACFSPDHSLTLAQMTQAAVLAVVEMWAQQYVELGAIDWIQSVQIFENRGAMMGASNPHPHCQIWATENIPNEIAKENETQKKYFAAHARTLLGDYWQLESERGERIVCENNSFVALVPFWAVWPFETMVISKRAVSGFDEMTTAEKNDLAEILSRLTTRYDNLFATNFPYSMGFHQRPTDGQSAPHWHWHAHFYPPLLRSATVRKFLVGFEMLAMPQRDLTAENVAAQLRAQSETHYFS